MIQRLGNVNFFAALPSGFYTILVLSIMVAALCPEAEFAGDSIWHPIEVAFNGEANSAMVIAVVLLSSYMAGASLRALPVTYASRIVPRSSSRPFPGLGELLRAFEELNAWKGIRRLLPVDPTGPLLYLRSFEKEADKSGRRKDAESALCIAFNLCKDWLCVHHQSAFSYYESFEARTRFFSGMLLASCVGFVCGVVSGIATTGASWPDRWGVAFVSFAIWGLCASAFNRARAEEARVLAFLYLATR